MLTYIIRRIIIAIPILFGVTILNFLIINLAPGSPVDIMIDPNLPPEALEAQKEALGLNDPFYIQYWTWLLNLFQGNLGYSLVTFQPVIDIISERLGPTILLMLSALIFGLLIAIPLGILSAIKQNSVIDYLATGGAFMGVSIPNFFLGLGLIYVFSLQLGVLPSGGMHTIGAESSFWDTALHFVLPVIVLATAIAGKKIRYVRSSMIETLGQDYLRTARAKGLKETIVVNKHALRNALIPIITVIGLEIPLLFAGAVVTEQIFSWPGIGQLTISSIMSRDYTTLMGLNLIAAFIVLFSNLITDIAYTIVDPRIKFQ
ncbi:ABC transporter permease [Neobacillus niacini]|uniref:ABC transporter permease n=1 Tax=Neobacillus niacini TaxID=86668 RepID=UPI000B1D293F|nr:ABC transporter permease [Neobacillus niacini]